MRVAVVADIHGNLPALEAVLAEVERERPDHIVSCGDVAAGPMPTETIERLRALPNARFVRGNADVLEDWAAEQVSDEQRDFLAGFQDTVTVEIDGLGGVLFCHGSPRSDVEVMLVDTPEERMRELLDGVDANVVVCGHTHMPFDRVVEGVRVVNPGSVGMPYGEPGAHWAMLGPGVDMRRTDYDRNVAAARIKASTWPRAEEFASGNVLEVPSLEEAMAYMRDYDLKQRSGAR